MNEGAIMSYPFYTAAETATQLSRIPGYGAEPPVCPPDALACASMLVERLCGLSFPPELCVRLAELCGAAENVSAFPLLAGALSGRFSLKLRVTGNADRALKQLGENSMAILQFPRPQGCDRSILVSGLIGGYVHVLDPGYDRGKGIPRQQKRTLKQQDEFLLVPPETFVQLYRTAEARCYVFSK